MRSIQGSGGLRFRLVDLVIDSAASTFDPLRKPLAINSDLTPNSNRR
jgi:hypothetical protein